jgi:protein-disulfide isomerase
MTWTILVLLIAVAIYMFGPMLIKHDPKKAQTTSKMIAEKSIKLIAIALLIVGVARLWTPYYLTKTNPGILREMVAGMQANEQKNSSDGIKKYIRSHGDEMMRHAPILGNKDAKKTIFIFTDFSCPYCRRVNGELQQVLKENKDVRVVVKNFSIHGVLSDSAARAMIASKMQNCDSNALNDALMVKNYWPADLKGQSQEKLEKIIKGNVLAAAQKAGCDIARMEKDMNSDVASGELAQTGELARQFGVNGTPFLIVGDQAFPGAIPAAQIQQALK